MSPERLQEIKELAAEGEATNEEVIDLLQFISDMPEMLTEYATQDDPNPTRQDARYSGVPTVRNLR